jgi:hypothetical protein
MKSVITTLLSLLLLGSPVMAERIPVEGWFKTTSTERGKTWRDSGNRIHFLSFKHMGEITIYGEGFGIKGGAQFDYGMNVFDKYQNASVTAKVNYTSEKKKSSYFQGHMTCNLTAGSATCVQWFKGFGEYDGKIMELTLNEKDSAASEDDPDTGPNLYMLEGIVMDEPTGE